MILSRTDRGDFWNGFIFWVGICATGRGTSGRIISIQLGWHRGIFVRTSMLLDVSALTALKVAVFHRRNDSFSAYIWHFSTLWLAPLN